MKIYKECCKNCLLSTDSIVSPKRRKEIINGCVKNQSYFICHKASQEEKEIVCHTYFKTLGHHSQMIRIAGRLNAIEMVGQPKSDKLPTYQEINNLK